MTARARIGTVGRSPLQRLTANPAWRLSGALHRASPARARLWWSLLLLRGALPPVIVVLAGWLIAAITNGSGLSAPLATLTAAFVVAQMVGPLHEAVGRDLGERTSTYLNDRLLELTTGPDGIAHLERADLAADLAMARDFDLGITGPPLSVSMGFIGDGLAMLVGGIASTVVLATSSWWQAILLMVAWMSTHWILRESGVWRDRQTPEVKTAQKHADYAYRLAVDPPAAKEVRLFGLGPWIVDGFLARRRRLYDLQTTATRLRQKSTIGALGIVLGGNVVAFWTIGERAVSGELSVAGTLVAATAALGVSGVAFGELLWSVDSSSAPVAAIDRLAVAMPVAGTLRQTGGRRTAAGHGPQIRFEDVTFGYPGGPPVLDRFTLTIPAGRSIAIVGQNGAGKTTLAKLICRLYDPTAGAVTVDGIDLPELDLTAWRRRVTAVFQDFMRLELPMRENVAADLSGTVDDPAAERALAAAGGAGLAELDTILSKAYPGGTDLSGGQWQRVALARALYRVSQGADVVLLDEPTAQLDVRGETEIFERVLEATRGRTTILVSHRFSTVRRADLICVLERGSVVELGTHEELMALGGRYRTMFELQAARFVERDESGREIEHERLD